jgi:hypothetical protein
MLKLYKKGPKGLQYWEAWQDNKDIVVHWGTVGDTGQDKKLRLKAGEDADSRIEQESQSARADGFEEIEPNSELVLQYKCDGWGSANDLEKRHQIEDLMNECLGWTGNGHCDGGDIGSGSMNVYCYVVDRLAGVEAVIAKLREVNLLDGALIASKHNVENEDEQYKVHWPLNFSGEFSPV